MGTSVIPPISKGLSVGSSSRGAPKDAPSREFSQVDPPSGSCRIWISWARWGNVLHLQTGERTGVGEGQSLVNQRDDRHPFAPAGRARNGRSI
jgi:hypothetical protein